MRMKLLLGVPAFSLATSVIGVVLGAAPGTDDTVVLRRLLATMGISLVMIVPVALILAYSFSEPLGELLAGRPGCAMAISRPGAGAVADEYGVLARSFNEAWRGWRRVRNWLTTTSDCWMRCGPRGPGS